MTGFEREQEIGRPAPAEGWREEKVRFFVDMWPIFQRIDHTMEALGYTPEDFFAVRLAISEAIINAIKHGHKLDPMKVVRFRYQVTPEEVAAEIVDEGPGFDPAQVPDPLAEENIGRPGGRGLFLMRTYMTWVRFNDVGNAVTLCRERAAQ
jgi:serine/threonine-protein kinase RsbW